jgi:hypothetical protein
VDSDLSLHDLAQRPVGDSFTVGQTAALPPANQLGLRVDVCEQLGDEAALSHAGLADDRHQLHQPLPNHPVQSPGHDRQLELTAHARTSMEPTHVAPVPGASGQRPPQGKRPRLALRGNGLELLELEHPVRRAIRLLTQSDRVHRRRGLDARSRVHHVTRDDPLTPVGTRTDRHDCLTRVDPNAYLQLEVRIDRIQLVDRVKDAQPGSHRTLCVILMRRRRAEDSHHRIADELLDRPAKPLDLRAQTPVIRDDTSPHIFRIPTVRSRGESHQIAKQNRDDLPLLERLRERLGSQSRTA